MSDSSRTDEPQEQQAPPLPGSTERRGTRRVRRRTVVLATAAVLLSGLALLVGGVAVLTQTDRGRAAILRVAMPVISAAIPGKLYVGKVSGTLFTDITIDSLDIRSADGAPLLSSGPIRMAYDPRDLLDRRIVVKSLDVTRPHLTIVDYGNDDWNWKRALRKPGATTAKRTSRFGSYIVVDTTTIRELTFTARLPWALSDTLKGAKRDSALAYNLANFMRTLALPEAVAQWSLTSLREKLVKIGAKVVRHARYAVFQMAEVAVPKEMFEKILRLIDGLRRRQAPA